jgi:hypothetical protein
MAPPAAHSREMHVQDTVYREPVITQQPPQALVSSVHKREVPREALVTVSHRDYHLPNTLHKDYIQPPAAHSTRSDLQRDSHHTKQTWQAANQQMQQGYRYFIKSIAFLDLVNFVDQGYFTEPQDESVGFKLDDWCYLDRKLN